MLLTRDDATSSAALLPSRHYVLFAGSGRTTRGRGDAVATFRTEEEARHAFRQLESAHPSHNRWAELAVLDSRGRLEPLCWFGPGPVEHDAHDADVIALADAVRIRDRRRQRQTTEHRTGHRRVRRQSGISTAMRTLTEVP